MVDDNNDNNNYRFIEGGQEQETMLSEDRTSPLHINEHNTQGDDVLQTMMRFSKYAIMVFAGCSMLYAFYKTATVNVTAASVQLLSTASTDIALPHYLSALNTTDPDWDAYSWMLTSPHVIGEPGQGKLIPGEVDIVRFVEDHFVFRTYGGGSKQCGYWWVLDPPKGGKETYFDHFAICSEWDDAENIVRCRVPKGFIAAVGIGQTADCPDSGKHLAPDPSNLQVNGNICAASIVLEQHLSCSYCTSNDFDLRLSSCSNNDPDYIDGFKYASQSSSTD